MKKRGEAERKISEILLKTGVRPHYKGYELLLRAMKLILEDPTILKSQVRRLYPEVGRLSGVSPAAVERAIRFSLAQAVESGGMKGINELYGYAICPSGVASSGEYLALITELILNDPDIVSPDGLPDKELRKK